MTYRVFSYVKDETLVHTVRAVEPSGEVSDLAHQNPCEDVDQLLNFIDELVGQGCFGEDVAEDLREEAVEILAA